MNFTSKYVYKKAQRPQQQQQLLPPPPPPPPQSQVRAAEDLLLDISDSATAASAPPPPPLPPQILATATPAAATSSLNRSFFSSAAERFRSFTPFGSATPKPQTAAACAVYPKTISSDDDEPDTNVVTITFEKLQDPTTMHAGDPVKCGHCDAYLSSLSKIEESKTEDKSKKSWTCEFCHFINSIDIEPEEISKENDVTYMLEPAPAQQKTPDNSEYVIFCIDISGSMSVTTEVRGNIRLPTDELRLRRQAEMVGEPIHQGFGGYNQVRHISRLEAVQVAIEDNLCKLEKENPNKKVGLVTFNHEVCAYGDGVVDAVTLCGDTLNSKDSIELKTKETGDYKSIKETKKILHDKLIQLEEGGATALGPALYYSILMASRAAGSQVILCTDGLANKGIGAIDTGEDVSTYYNELASFATTHGVSVSVITIEGTNCKLGLIGDIADKTGGKVNIVNPLNMKDEFSSILEEQIIATNVTAKFILHKAMYIKDYENINNRQSIVDRRVGNVTKDTEITFEFSLRDDADIDENVTKEIPFQLQITYNGKDNSKALRILTQLRPITNDKNLAEKEADRAILAAHCFQTNARLMQQGPVQQQAFRRNQSKWKGYIKHIGSKGTTDDNFSENEYEKMDREMDDLMAPIERMTTRATSNAYSEVSDEQATKGYKMAKAKPMLLKKKK